MLPAPLDAAAYGNPSGVPGEVDRQVRTDDMGQLTPLSLRYRLRTYRAARPESEGSSESSRPDQTSS